MAFDHLVAMATTGSIPHDFTASEVNFMLIGIIATVLVGLGSITAVMVLKSIASAIPAIKHGMIGTNLPKESIQSVHLMKFTTTANHNDADTVASSGADSSLDAKDTARSTIVNNYTTHIHGPIINVGAEAVGSLRRMLELGPTSGRMLDADEESEEEEGEEQEHGEEDDW